MVLPSSDNKPRSHSGVIHPLYTTDSVALVHSLTASSFALDAPPSSARRRSTGIVKARESKVRTSALKDSGKDIDSIAKSSPVLPS